MNGQKSYNSTCKADLSRFCQHLLSFLSAVATLITLTSLASTTSLHAIAWLFYLSHSFPSLPSTQQTSHLASIRLEQKSESQNFLSILLCDLSATVDAYSKSYVGEIEVIMCDVNIRGRYIQCIQAAIGMVIVPRLVPFKCSQKS